ncbi:helix-turn-helix transcriptional regulator [Actinocrinis puniceicyclus]|uniref:Helix-turn-helix transcriptional regulator n=1 Tax=Actinocrinis puniceicyclus TaxID=977794 RepID=A0A8J7WHZ8_9ACTN|nr:PadR family transcriptional regulator [Actinocrinis puniceicyclus]MBS2961668.1 helix-turn-helix transcriptional regulator [Actinocrinis puniceicyclus]
MTFPSFPMDGPFRERRGRDRRGRVDQGGREERHARWEHGEHPEPHEGPHEHRGHGRGRRGGFGNPPLPPVPPGPFGFGGPEFWDGPGFGPRGHRRGRGRAGRGDVRAAIVALLAEEPRNGYQIIQEIEQRTDGAWRASSGSVYPALAQLEDEGLIEQAGEGGRKLFTLTEAGREHAEQHAEHLSRLWQEAAGPGERFGEFARDRDLVTQLIMAYRQVTHVGSGAQREEARAVLTKARQSLYKILAADEEPHDAEPGE